MENRPKKERLPEDDIILHYAIDGVRYALRHNKGDDPNLTGQELFESLKRWFPDVDILPKDVFGPEPARRINNEDGS